MDIGADKLAQAFHGKLTRNILLLIALAISITTYTYVVDIYDSNANFLKQVWRGIFQESYTFCSGAEGGFYCQIGRLLERETARNAGIVVHDKPTSGGFENAVSVGSKSSAFGLLQEDTLTQNDSLRDRLRYITPLYLERMHILYRTDKIESQKPLLLSPCDKATKSFFQDPNTRVSSGPHGSGSKIFSEYLLSQCGYGRVNDLNLQFTDAMEKLKAKELNVVFTIAGAPLSSVKKILSEDENIALMSIDPVLIPTLNKDFGLRLHPTTFKDIYDKGTEVSTIGSYAYLVASKDVPNSAIMELITTLDDSKYRMEGYNEDESFPLEEFGFKDAFAKEYEGFLMEVIRSLFVFLTSVVTLTAGTMVFLVWLVSGLKQVGYFYEITQIYDNFLPVNTNLDERTPPFPRPVVFENQNEIIARLVRAIAQLKSAAQKIRQDYESGGITMTHYRNLLDTVHEIKDIFLRHLAQRLNEIMENKTSSKKELRKLFRCYYTAGYLKRANYRDLVACLDANKKSSKR